MTHAGVDATDGSASRSERGGIRDAGLLQGQVWQLTRQEATCLRSNVALLLPSAGYRESQIHPIQGQVNDRMPPLGGGVKKYEENMWNRSWCDSHLLHCHSPTSLLTPRQRSSGLLHI